MSRLTRRHTIQGLLAANALALAPRLALGESQADPRLVVVGLRGALDGLAAVPPYGDRDYRARRGALALRGPGEAGGVVDLDGFFGLHPALAPLHAFYATGQMLVVPSSATSCANRLHGAGCTYLDDGRAGEDGTPQGWFDRAQIELAARRDGGDEVWRDPSMSATGYSHAVDLLADLCHGNTELGALLAPYGGGTELEHCRQERADRFRRSAIAAGQALARRDGPRFALLESFGWDTHADQGADDGRLANALAGLADGLVALADACGDTWRSTAVLVATEFGRSVGVNSMGGTDHGTASAAFLLGGAVAGGRIIGDWPGLAADRLLRARDLVPTVDLHAIVKAALVEHLRLPRDVVERRVLPVSAALSAQPGLFRG